jgi:lipoprotein-anchoring transpeptidase ErfK/SrfK
VYGIFWHKRQTMRKTFFFVAVLMALAAFLRSPAQARAATPGAPSAGVYVVQGDETLEEIAARFKVTIAQIQRWNPRTKDWSAVKDGQQIDMPDSYFASPDVTPDPAKTTGKFIFVSIPKQTMTVYQDGKLVKTFKVSTGEPAKPTKIGNFRIKTKMDSAWSRSWRLTMPNWLGIYDIYVSENGIHALPINTAGRKMWAGLIGRRVSYGCVVLKDADSKWLYAFAELGTPVIIR